MKDQNKLKNISNTMLIELKFSIRAFKTWRMLTVNSLAEKTLAIAIAAQEARE